MPTVPAIADTDRLVDYSPVVSTGTFIVPWPVVADTEAAASSDLTVLIDGATTAAFTFAGNSIAGVSGVWNGGTITLTTAVTGVRVIIYSNRRPRRTGNFVEGRPLPMTTLDALMNDIAIQLRDLHLGFKRSIKFSPSDIIDDVSTEVIEEAVDRASKFLGFNAGGGLAILTGTGGGDASLRTDLAAALLSSGDNLVQVKRSNAGSAALTLHNWIESQTINAVEFGVDGDDVTDNATALEDLFGEAVASNQIGTFFPRGTYRSSALINASNVSLIGSGAVATTFRPTDAHAAAAVILIDDTAGGGGGVNSIYSNFRIHGNRATVAGSPAGIKLSGNVLYNKFDTIRINEVKGPGILFDGTGAIRPHVNTFINVNVNGGDSDGLKMNAGRHATFTGCAFENLDGKGINITSSTSAVTNIALKFPLYIENVLGDGIYINDGAEFEIEHPLINGYGSTGAAAYGIRWVGSNSVSHGLKGGAFVKNASPHADSKHVRIDEGFLYTTDLLGSEVNAANYQIIGETSVSARNCWHSAVNSLQQLHFSNPSQITAGNGTHLGHGQSATYATVAMRVVGQMFLTGMTVEGVDDATVTVYRKKVLDVSESATSFTVTAVNGAYTVGTGELRLEEGDTWSVYCDCGSAAINHASGELKITVGVRM